MKNKGFTLVELISVIVILGLLMTIAIPSGLALSKKVKARAYDTKIEMIESSASSYGESSINTVKKSTTNCTISDDNIEFNTATGYPCIEKTIKDLVKKNYLNYDEETYILNPINNKVINNCKVYIYYKNNRIYSKFDRKTCSDSIEVKKSSYVSQDDE